MPPTTPNQRLATLALGRDVTAWIVERRASDPQPSYRTIATELRERTLGQVDITDETIRLWHDGAVAAEQVGA